MTASAVAATSAVLVLALWQAEPPTNVEPQPPSVVADMSVPAPGDEPVIEAAIPKAPPPEQPRAAVRPTDPTAAAIRPPAPAPAAPPPGMSVARLERPAVGPVQGGSARLTQERTDEGLADSLNRCLDGALNVSPFEVSCD